MSSIQLCSDVSDAVPLYLAANLFLKPLAKMDITVQLEIVKNIGKSISNYSIMEQLRRAVLPEVFTSLKISKSTLQFVIFEAEIGNKNDLPEVLKKLNNLKISLSDIAKSFPVLAKEFKHDFPTRLQWDKFFHEAKDMDEMRPGERPDTIHLGHLPIKWFVRRSEAHNDSAKPCEKLMHRIFQKFGDIRNVDIPISDPFRKRMKPHLTGIRKYSFDDEQFFEAYIQFHTYSSFCKALEALKGMKLMLKRLDEYYTTTIEVNFDKTKHMTDAVITRRDIVRNRLMARDQELEEADEKVRLDAEKAREQDLQKVVSEQKVKESRRLEREEKRKSKQIENLKNKDIEEINGLISKEECKLLRAQRKLEALRLITELFRRLAKRTDLIKKYSKKLDLTKKDKKSKKVLVNQWKCNYERKIDEYRQNLNEAREDQTVLKNIVAEQIEESNSIAKRSGSMSSISSKSSTKSSSSTKTDKKHKKHTNKRKKKKRKKHKKSKKRDSSSGSESEDSQKMFNPSKWMNVNPLQAGFPNIFSYAFNPYLNMANRGGGRGRFFYQRALPPSWNAHGNHRYRYHRSYSRSRSSSRSRSRRNRSNSRRSLSRSRSRSKLRSKSRKSMSRSRSRSRRRLRTCERRLSRSRSRTKERSEVQIESNSKRVFSKSRTPPPREQIN